MTATLPVRDDDPIFDLTRLASVAATALLDTPADAAFDDLTRLAAVLIEAPFAFATVVDDRRSFWKSSYGLPAGAPRQNTVEESFCQYVVRSGDELIVADAALDERTRCNPSVEAMGVRAWAGFPLVAPDGEIVGSFCVVDTKPREWTAREREVLRTLSAAAAREIALRAAVSSERELRLRAEALTHTLQSSLLPPALPDVPGLDVAARFHPAGTGIDLVGDFYDLFESGPGRYSFVIGDVCGKGLEAAKSASLARHAVGSAAITHDDPREVMRTLNATFMARREGAHVFLTALYGTLETTPAGCAIRLACAGHLPPILRHANGRTIALDVLGPLIGVFPHLEIDEFDVLLAPGEALVIYTDGVSEARAQHGAIFGEERVRALIADLPIDAGAAAIALAMETAALEHAGGVASDDIGILVLRVPAV